MRNAFVNVILEECLQREDIFIISGDAGLGVFDDFSRAYPDRFLNMGIAEQNTIGFAAGMALTGFRVYVYNIIPFVLYRCYEQVRNDICYQNLPVTLIGIGSGITYAPMGMTHYSVEDIGLAATLPNLEVFSPIDPIEARLAARHTLTSGKPSYIRLAKRGEPDLHGTDSFDIRQPQLLRNGSDIALVCHGSMGEETLKTAALLQEQNISARVISLPCIQPLDTDRLFTMLNGVPHAFMIEEHFGNSGAYAALAQAWVASPQAWRLHSLALPWNYIHEVNNSTAMREHFGLDAKSMASHIKGLS